MLQFVSQRLGNVSFTWRRAERLRGSVFIHGEPFSIQTLYDWRINVLYDKHLTISIGNVSKKRTNLAKCIKKGREHEENESANMWIFVRDIEDSRHSPYNHKTAARHRGFTFNLCAFFRAAGNSQPNPACRTGCASALGSSASAQIRRVLCQRQGGSRPNRLPQFSCVPAKRASRGCAARRWPYPGARGHSWPGHGAGCRRHPRQKRSARHGAGAHILLWAVGGVASTVQLQNARAKSCSNLRDIGSRVSRRGCNRKSQRCGQGRIDEIRGDFAQKFDIIQYEL